MNLYLKYKNNIKIESDLDVSLLNQNSKAKKFAEENFKFLNGKDIWLIKAWGLSFNLRSLVDFLFKYNLDIFDIEYGSVTKIYVCKIDEYKIQNSVVYSLRNY